MRNTRTTSFETPFIRPFSQHCIAIRSRSHGFVLELFLGSLSMPVLRCNQGDLSYLVPQMTTLACSETLAEFVSTWRKGATKSSYALEQVDYSSVADDAVVNTLRDNKIPWRFESCIWVEVSQFA